MLGLAQQLFVERERKNPWNHVQGFFSSFNWPLLESLLIDKQLSYVDVALAELLLKDYPGIDESAAAFICHLSIAARAGHLCVKVKEGEFFPDIYDCWPLDFDHHRQESTFHSRLREAILKGAQSLPTSLVFDITDRSSFPTEPICRSNGLYYLQRYWILEKRFSAGFSKLLIDTPLFKVDHSVLEAKISELKNQLTPEQREAVIKGCMQNFLVILGGPGTGKTYTAGYLIKILWECLDQEQRQQFRIALAAPTGKATANLQMSIQKALKDAPDFPDVTSHTLHSLLNIRHSRSQHVIDPPVLSCDLLVVDESSMLDVNLIGRLLSSVKPRSRLIMLGDKHQLPPIEAGSLFSDLISHLQLETPQNHLVELKTCLRTERQNIVDLASQIKQGNSSGVLDILSQSQEGVRLVTCELAKESRRWQQALLDYALPLLPESEFSLKDSFQVFQKYNRFRLLAPYRKGPFGVDSLNRLFFESSYKNSSGEWFVAPIMIVKSDYRLELFNGETGILIRRRPSIEQSMLACQEGDFALFPTKNLQKEPVRTFSALLLPKFEYAYCLSVYKSQGSEFDHVLLVLPEGLNSFSRELLYTAVTRARNQLEIWCNHSTLQQIICRDAHRLSGLSR